MPEELTIIEVNRLKLLAQLKKQSFDDLSKQLSGAAGLEVNEFFPDISHQTKAKHFRIEYRQPIHGRK